MDGLVEKRLCLNVVWAFDCVAKNALLGLPRFEHHIRGEGLMAEEKSKISSESIGSGIDRRTMIATAAAAGAASTLALSPTRANAVGTKKIETRGAFYYPMKPGFDAKYAKTDEVKAESILDEVLAS